MYFLHVNNSLRVANFQSVIDYLFFIAACAAANLAIGTLYGEQET